MSTEQSKKRVAVVTGSSRGIGAAIALRLAKDGFHLIVNYSSNEGPAIEIVSQIEMQYGKGRAIAVRADMGSMSDVNALAAKAIEFGAVHFLCCNTGIAPTMDLKGITEQSYDEVFGVNFKGHLFLVQALAPKMPPQSSILMISSCSTFMTNTPPNMLLYTASKGALEQTSKVLAKDLGSKQIRVNCLSPGPITSALFFEVNNTEEKLAFWRSLSPMGRLGEPEDVASAVSFFAGPDSRWISGQNFRADGGAVVG